MAIAFVRNSGQVATKASAGGEVEITITAGSVGNKWIVIVVSALENGASEITDSASDTFQLDKAAHDGASVSTQIWSSKITSNGVTALKVKGLGALTIVEVAVYEFSGIKAANWLRTTGTGIGVGSVVSAGPTEAALQESDVWVAAFGSTATLGTFTKGGSATALTGADQTGGSLGAEYLLSPAAEKATGTGSFSVTGTWAGVIAAYKAAPTNQTLAASLSFTGGVSKQTKRSLAAATLKPTGVLVKNSARMFAAWLGFAGTYPEEGFYPSEGVYPGEPRVLAGQLVKQPARGLSASLPPTGALSRQMSAAFGAVLSIAGQISKLVGYPLAAKLYLSQIPANLIRNPSFEQNAGKWAVEGVGGTIASSTEQAKIGTHSGKVQLNSANKTAILRANTAPATLIEPQQNYCARIWLWVPFAGKFNMHLEETRASSFWTVASDQGEITTPEAGWHEFTWTGFSFPGTFEGLYFVLESPKSFEPAQALFIDGVQLSIGSALQEYADGEQPGYVWAGTAGASQTYRASTDLTRGIARPFGAGLGLGGALSRVSGYMVALSGTLGSAGTLARTTQRSFTASLGPTGTIVRETLIGLAASVSATGSLARERAKGFGASLGLTGNLGAAKLYHRSLEATLAFSGGLLTRVGHKIRRFAGLVNPRSRSGRVNPGTWVQGLYPSPGLYPSRGLYPTPGHRIG